MKTKTTLNYKRVKSKRHFFRSFCKMIFIPVLFFPMFVSAQLKGTSSSQSAYILPVSAGVQTKSILTANDSVNGYPMVGVPDGLGIYDNGDGTFTLLSNHELLVNEGRARAHGSIGAFVSKWIIRKPDLAVLSGTDLIHTVNLWNGSGYTSYDTNNVSSATIFQRFCSGDLAAASAYYNSNNGIGTHERIYMNGEEVSEGRAMAHIITGPNAGTSYQLPWFGKISWENSVANPYEQDKTIVGGMDDASITTGNVYFYIGTKTNSGSEIDKAGLSYGKLYGLKVTGYPLERVSTTVINPPPAAGTRFELVDLGDVTNLTGAQLDSVSSARGATHFSRPEDGAWNPSSLSDFYFNTTDQIDQVNDGVGTQVGRARLWHLRFDDVSNPEAGGTIEAALDGTEGQNMLDNLTIDHFGHIILLEDVGNSAHNGKVWLYDIATDQLTQIAKHDPNRFGDIGIAATAPYNQDEETSGVIDAHDVLGAGMFLLDDQAHYRTGIPPDVVEGGQYMQLYVPGLCSVPAVPQGIKGEKRNVCAGGTYTYFVKASDDATSYTWDVPSDITVVSTSALGDSITVTIPADIEKDTLSVVANNSCGASEPKLTIIRGKPAGPEVNGPDCVNANQSGIVYTVTNAEEGVTYIWKVSNGAVITNGQGTSQITVTWRNKSGLLKVTASNDCGSSGRVYAISVCAGEAASAKTLTAATEFSVKAYPNPTNGNITVQVLVQASGKYAVEVYDINGKMIQKKELTAQTGINDLKLDLSRLPKGDYLIKVSNDANSVTQKIVITK